MQYVNNIINQVCLSTLSPPLFLCLSLSCLLFPSLTLHSVVPFCSVPCPRLPSLYLYLSLPLRCLVLLILSCLNSPVCLYRKSISSRSACNEVWCNVKIRFVDFPCLASFLACLVWFGRVGSGLVLSGVSSCFFVIVFPCDHLVGQKEIR